MSDPREPSVGDQTVSDAPAPSPGRRSRRAQRSAQRGSVRGYLEHRYAPLAAVVTALAVVWGLAHVTRPEPARAGQDAGTQRAPVETNLMACPDPSSSPGERTRVGVATSSQSRGPGRAEIRPAGGQQGANPVGVVRRPGTAWYGTHTGGTGPLSVRADGSLAAGLEVEQTTKGSGDGPGLAGIRCAPPGMDFWFVGLGQAAGANGRLYLTNLDETTATVDVDAYTSEGTVDPLDGRSITVQPHSQQTVPVRELAPNTGLVALSVRTIIGRVSAAVRTQNQDPTGVDWLPVAGAPSTEQVIPGLPPGTADQQLLLAAPGAQNASVTVHVVTKGGTYVPEGRRSVQVPAGSALGVDLGGALSGKAAAVRLTSDVPITGGAFVAGDAGAGGSDVGYAAATPALDDAAVVADNRAGDGRKTSLLLSAPEEDAQVRISTLTSRGKTQASSELRIPGGRTVSANVRGPEGSQDGFAVVVEPQADSGPVYGARLQTENVTGGRMFTLLPLVTARTWVTVPDVSDSLSSVLAPSRR
ncbi:MAG: hypothetical protein GEV03_05040 [Streptosporangiales bacterium]|nr:hypothetical protein [Streptosporangiales bacterium]